MADRPGTDAPAPGGLDQIAQLDLDRLDRRGYPEAVFCEGKTADQVLVLLDDARETMAQRRFVNRDTEQAIGTVTFSGGIADIHAFANSRTALKAADGALYKAKEAGRNRICVAEADAELPVS